jgi:hypothetical protein
MRNKFFRILLFNFFLLCFMTGCTKNFNYYEDKLYSEQTLIGAKPSESPASNNILTREKALQKAVDIFDKGLNIKIDRTQFSESIKISRDNSTGNLQWHLSWQKLTDKVFYYVVLDASNNELLEISSTDSRLYTDDVIAVLTQEEINNIIKPLLKEINIDLNAYVIKPLARTTEMSKRDIGIYLLSIRDGRRDYSIIINSSRKVVTRFSVLKESDRRIQEKNAYEKNFGS